MNEPIRNADSSLMGKAAEHLVAASCIILSRAKLNVSTTLVDDEGVDLVFHGRGGGRTLAVQVKARMSDAKSLRSGRFHANVRAETLRPRDDFHVLFVAVDVAAGIFDTCWLVPSLVLVAQARRDNLGRYRFNASAKPITHDQWSSYRLGRLELPARILELIVAEGSPTE